MNRKALSLVVVLGLSAALFAWAQDSFTANPVQASVPTILVKGDSTLVDSTATITLPSWFEATAQPSGRVVILTCRNGQSPLSASAVTNGSFTVSTKEEGSPTQAFTWVVIADKR